MVNKTKSTGENAFNGDHLGTEGNHESSNNEKDLFWVFLLICVLCFTLDRKGVYIRFLSILWLLQLLSHLLLGLETRSKLISFYTKF